MAAEPTHEASVEAEGFAYPASYAGWSGNTRDQ